MLVLGPCHGCEADPDVEVVPGAPIEITPHDLVTQGVDEQKVYLFDWGRLKLGPGVSIDFNLFTLTLVKPVDGTPGLLVKDTEQILADGRRCWLRLYGNALVAGYLYRVASKITTDENPAQVFERSFYLLIE